MVEAGNNVGSDSHKLGGSCCGSAGCHAAIVSRMHDVRSAQGDERGDVSERSESNLRETQSGDRRARLNYAPPEHESTRWSTIGVGVERGGCGVCYEQGSGCHGQVGGCDSTECCRAARTNCSPVLSGGRHHLVPTGGIVGPRGPNAPESPGQRQDLDTSLPRWGNNAALLSGQGARERGARGQKVHTSNGLTRELDNRRG